MSSGVNYDDYLITFEIAFNRNLRRSTDRAVARMRKMPKTLQKRFQEITVAVRAGGGLPVTWIAKPSFKPHQWEALAKETENLRDDLFSNGGRSGLGLQAERALNNVFTNIAIRLSTTGLNVITGQLVDAMSDQVPVIEEFKTTGIKAAIGNIRSLNAATPPYVIDKKTGAVKLREDGEAKKKYKYDTGKGAIEVDGYWGFQEFGTRNGVMPRGFLLDLNREIHSEDDAEFIKVNQWLDSRVKAYNATAKGIMG